MDATKETHSKIPRKPAVRTSKYISYEKLYIPLSKETSDLTVNNRDTNINISAASYFKEAQQMKNHGEAYDINDELAYHSEDFFFDSNDCGKSSILFPDDGDLMYFEYVNDPKSEKNMPTRNAAHFKSISVPNIKRNFPFPELRDEKKVNENSNFSNLPRRSVETSNSQQIIIENLKVSRKPSEERLSQQFKRSTKVTKSHTSSNDFESTIKRASVHRNKGKTFEISHMLPVIQASNSHPILKELGYQVGNRLEDKISIEENANVEPINGSKLTTTEPYYDNLSPQLNQHMRMSVLNPSGHKVSPAVSSYKSPENLSNVMIDKDGTLVNKKDKKNIVIDVVIITF